MRIPWLPQSWGLPGRGLQQWCAIGLAATGTFALASLIPFLAAGRPAAAHFPLNVLYAPAWFLFDAFLWLALLIPALCYAYVFVLFSDRVTREMLGALAATGLFLPVVSILAHVVLGADAALAAAALVAAFGRVPAAILLILVLILEGVATFALLSRFGRGRRRPAATVNGAASLPVAANGSAAALADDLTAAAPLPEPVSATGAEATVDRPSAHPPPSNAAMAAPQPPSNEPQPPSNEPRPASSKPRPRAASRGRHRHSRRRRRRVGALGRAVTTCRWRFSTPMNRSRRGK